MPEYLSPGVYVEEQNTGARSIEGVATSTMGIVGQSERGPEDARLITSWLEFQRWYGKYIDESYLAYAVQGFFSNGGQRCFVSRIVGNGAVASQAPVGPLTVVACGRGQWGDGIALMVSPAGSGNNDLVKVTIIYYRILPDGFPDSDPFVNPLNPFNSSDKERRKRRREPDAIEVYDNLSLKPGDSNFIETVLNSNSHLVKVWWNPASDAVLPKNPAPPSTPEADGPAWALTRLSGGDNGAAITVAEYKGSGDTLIPSGLDVSLELLGRGTGLEALANVDQVALLLAPDEVKTGYGEALTDEVIKQCELLKDRFAIVSAKQGQSSVSNIQERQDTTYAGFYYPWIKIYDPATNTKKLIPPGGHVAGIIARTDIERGVHKAPANEVVRDAMDLEFPVPKGMQDILNPIGVNCIRDFRSDGLGIRLWGARTMSSDSMWKYVNVRRLFIFIEESIQEGTQWVVFEPNSQETWAAVRRTITNFLIGVLRSGALMGPNPEQAFFVRCDRTTMTQDDIDNGRLVCLIGIAPVKPAEFVIFRISQFTAEATT